MTKERTENLSVCFGRRSFFYSSNLFSYFYLIINNLKHSAMKKLMIFVISVITPLILAAQVQLMDLSVKPLMNIDNSTDSVQLLIQFKLNPVSQAQNVQFKFGTQVGQGDILNGTASIIQIGQVYSVNYDNKQTPVRNYEAQIFCTLTQIQYNAWQKLTVYVQDNSGGQSNQLVWSK